MLPSGLFLILIAGKRIIRLAVPAHFRTHRMIHLTAKHI